MVVVKRQRREKPVKIEQRKVREQSEYQTALLASPIYTGQAQVRRKNIKRGAKIEPRSSLLFPSFGLTHPHALRMYFPLHSK